MRDLELKFPEEIKEQKMNTPYQLELYTLQRKFKLLSNSNSKF